MKSLLLAEKPSVARNIADALDCKVRRDGYFEGEKHIVTWAFGHLLELYDTKEYDEKMTGWRMENYPFIPGTFKYKVKKDSMDRSKEDEGAKKQVAIINSLFNREDVGEIISACDFDREGQIIGDIIIDFIETKKPVKRLLLNEWTKTEVEEGMAKLIDNHDMLPLKKAGISRQWADWVIGINLTSVATLKYQRGSGKALNIGRVLMPTLKIIYDRDMEIERFIPEEFHKLIGDFTTEGDTKFQGTYKFAGKDKFEDKKHLLEVEKVIKSRLGKVKSRTTEKKKEYPPYLFNLSNLQGYVTSKNKGWTSDKVLKVAQELYEKKFITYPRTSSMALEESLMDKAKKVLQVHKKGLPFEEQIQFTKSKRVFDNSKVESHSAIMPTYMKPKGLSKDELIIYNTVKNRFIMQFMPVAEHEDGSIEVVYPLNDQDEITEIGLFYTKGRTQLVEGWRIVEGIESKDNKLPMVKIEEPVKALKDKIETKGTKPPKKHTEKTLLKVMETCGKKFKNEDDKEAIDAILSGFSIGTPATRAETIKKLKTVGYITQKGKSLTVTDMGKSMIELFPIKSLFDLEYTGRLEKKLFEIGKGKYEQDDFLNDIFTFTKDAVNKIKLGSYHIISITESNNRIGNENALGTCPNCGSDVMETETNFGCCNWGSGCKYTIWKNDRFLAQFGIKPNKITVMKLLKEGRVIGRGLKSKKGNVFNAILTYEKNSDNDYFSWKMEFFN